MKAANRTQKVQRNKKNYMSDGVFAGFKEAFEDALAYQRGNRRDLIVTRIHAPLSNTRSLKTIFPDRIEE